MKYFNKYVMKMSLLGSKELTKQPYVNWPNNSYWIVVFIILGVILTFPTYGQTLNDYIDEAWENNPELQALQYKYEIAQEKALEVGSLPNTALGAGYFMSEPETRTGAQKAKFSARQDIPWFGVLKAKKAGANAGSEVHKNAIEIANRKVALEVKKNYYTLYALQAQRKVLEAQKKVMEHYREIALSALENNKASAVDVLKINIAQNELENREEIIKGATLNTETTFNKILNRDGFEDLVIPENLAITEEEPAMAMDEVLYHPELLKYDHLDSLVQQQNVINSRERIPSFGIGLEYVVVQERPELNFEDNGKDIVMPMVSLSVPIFSKKYKSKAKQYDLQQKSLIQQRQQAQNQLEGVLESAINDRITARINYDTQVKNVEQASNAEEVLMVGYETGNIDFRELLEVQQLLLDFEIKKIETVKMYFIQTAIINYMM